MPRGKKAAGTASDQAKDQGMKWSAKDKKKYEDMQKNLEETLKKHREEMEKLAAEHEEKPDSFEHIGAALDPEEKPETKAEEKPEAIPEDYDGSAAIIEEHDADELYPLKDPTEGQDLSHNYDLTMEQFCEKTLSLLGAASQAVRSMLLRFGNYESKISQLQEQIKHRAMLEQAVGFKYLSYGKWYTPRLNPCPKCGRKPSLQKEKYDKGWMVICDECWTRTESADGPMAAVKNWNEGKETEISRMLNEPLASK